MSNEKNELKQAKQEKCHTIWLYDPDSVAFVLFRILLLDCF